MTTARAGIALLLLAGAIALAQQPVPALTGRVVDQTGTLSGPQVAELEARLEALEQAKGSQLAVLVVASTRPESIEQYSLRVAETWQLGRADPDDGALLLVARDDRELRIEVGYGLEGAIPDATANRVIDEFMVPRFREDDYAGGIAAGVERLAGLIEGETLPPPAQPTGGLNIEALLPIAFFLSLGLGGTLKRMLGQLPGSLAIGGVMSLLAWLILGVVAAALMIGVMTFLFTLFSNSAPSRWNTGGRGRRGGFGGGGFSGGGGGFRGGGGSFGGGGASGRW